MTTQTITLADFLLARITEDEAVFKRLYGHRPDRAHALARKRLAECEAKRRIVGAARGVIQTRSAYASYADDSMLEQMAATYETVLGFLAQPYADHPDFREEWRVSPVAGSHKP